MDVFGRQALFDLTINLMIHHPGLGRSSLEDFPLNLLGVSLSVVL